MTHFLITGHTGFKGAWLALLLSRMGHEVSGIALDPVGRTLFEDAHITAAHRHDFRQDIRDADGVNQAVATVRPDVVIHLAAQPLVRRSFERPRETVTTNVMGTYNILEAVSLVSTVRATLIVTTDKVYRPAAVGISSAEDHALGGHDIYSASKSMADILTSAWAHSLGSTPTAIGRAGNVIGGGDYGEDRLVPDLIAALTEGTIPELRYPNAVRPWQHVLDCLSGYVAILNNLLNGSEGREAATWNIGPGSGSFATVSDITSRAFRTWGIEPHWTTTPSPAHAENPWLALDTDRIRTELGWRDELDLDASVDWTIDWYHRIALGEDPRDVTLEQIDAYLELGSCRILDPGP